MIWSFQRLPLLYIVVRSRSRSHSRGGHGRHAAFVAQNDNVACIWTDFGDVDCSAGFRQASIRLKKSLENKGAKWQEMARSTNRTDQFRVIFRTILERMERASVTPQKQHFVLKRSKPPNRSLQFPSHQRPSSLVSFGFMFLFQFWVYDFLLEYVGLIY